MGTFTDDLEMRVSSLLACLNYDTLESSLLEGVAVAKKETVFDVFTSLFMEEILLESHDKVHID